jgi:triacylglycerol lipase
MSPEAIVTIKTLPPPSSELLFFPESDDQYVHFEDAQQHPFDHRPQGFERVNAWWLADAALLAYWDEAPAQPIWSRAGLRFQFISNEGGQCHIGYNDAFAIVAFRGTQPDDWHDVFDISRVRHADWKFGGGQVHRGFLDAHDRIWRPVQTALKDLKLLDRPLWLTGHSLGAALATLSMDRLGTASGLYTIGSPPVGDRRFANGFNRRHSGRCFRYVNHADIVVHLPTLLRLILGSYVHIKERRYIDRRGAISKAGASLFDRLSLVFASRVPPRVGKRGDIIPLPDFLVDHTPRRYAVHIWNDYAINNATSPAST